MRMNGMPSVATKQDPATNKCYAAVAYDAFYGQWIKNPSRPSVDAQADIQPQTSTLRLLTRPATRNGRVRRRAFPKFACSRDDRVVVGWGSRARCQSRGPRVVNCSAPP